MKKIKTESFSLLCLFIVNTTIWFVISNAKITQGMIIFLDIWIIVCYIFMLHAVRRGCNGINYLSAWLVISIPFYFSQILFFYYNQDVGYLDNIRSIFNGIFTDETILKTAFFSLDCLLILTFAAVESYEKSQNSFGGRAESEDIEENSMVYGDNSTLKYMHIVGTVLFAASIIPTIYYWIYAGTVGRTLGYSEMKAINAAASRSSLIFYSSVISGWFLPSCYMLIISSKSKLETSLVKLALAGLALLIFRAGTRYRAIEIVVAYVLIDRYWIDRDKKINLKKYVVIIGAVFVISVLIRLARIGGNYSGLGSISILSSLVGDTGSTNMINCAALQFIPDKADYGYGISFLYGLVAVLPNSLRQSIFPNFQTDITGDLLTKMSGVTWSSFGSSIIAEGFFNFGYFSLLLMILYGVMIGKIVNIQKNRIGQLSPCKFLAYVYICSEFVFAIRSEFSSSFRSIIYYVLIPIVLVKILESTSGRKVM